MMRSLKVLFGFILVAMLVVTTWASLDKNVVEGFKIVWAEPWGLATLADAYFGFLTFYAWLFYREPGWAARIGWFIVIMVLGNIGMSFYVLLALYRLGPDATVEDLLLRRPA